jgi:hypothetical protein
MFLAVGTDGGSPTDVFSGVQLLDGIDKRWNTFSLENDLCFTQTWLAQEWLQALKLGDMSQVECFLRSLNGLSCDFTNDDSLRTRFVVPMVVPTKTGQRSFSNTMLHAIIQQDFYGMTLRRRVAGPTRLRRPHMEKQDSGGLETGRRRLHQQLSADCAPDETSVIHGEEFVGSKMPGHVDAARPEDEGSPAGPVGPAVKPEIPADALRRHHDAVRRV